MAADKALNWFQYDGMWLNSGKCKLLVSGHNHKCMIMNVGKSKVIECNVVKLLGITMESDISINNHLSTMCKKASQKLNTHSWLCNVIPFFQRKILMNAFFMTPFSYSPLVWMCHNRTFNRKINNLHYRILRSLPWWHIIFYWTIGKRWLGNNSSSQSSIFSDWDV